MSALSWVLLVVIVLCYPIWVVGCRKNYCLKFKVLILVLGEFIFISNFLQMYRLLLPALFLYGLVWYIYMVRRGSHFDSDNR